MWLMAGKMRINRHLQSAQQKTDILWMRMKAVDLVGIKPMKLHKQSMNLEWTSSFLSVKKEIPQLLKTKIPLLIK